MNRLELCCLRSVDELCGAAPSWNALWQRSDVSMPLARAEFVAHWLTRFGPDCAFHGLVVKRGETFLAALPLVGPRSATLRNRGGLPANHWSLCGDFLIDSDFVDGSVDASAVCELLAEGLNEAPWPLLCLAPVAYGSLRWQLLAAAAGKRGLSTLVADSDCVGQVCINGSWDEYRASRSSNHRRYLRKARRRAEQSGELSLEMHVDGSAAEIDVLMRRGCEIEDRSWKGAAGTSILRSPRIFGWYLEQAQRLAAEGHLQITFLNHCGRPIAFEYGYRAKSTYYSPKVGYDEAYAGFSPGQLLRAMLLERLFAQGDIQWVDFWGPLSDATAKWTTRQYRVGKLWIAPRRLLSGVALAGYAALQRLKHLALPQPPLRRKNALFRTVYSIKVALSN